MCTCISTGACDEFNENSRQTVCAPRYHKSKVGSNGTMHALARKYKNSARTDGGCTGQDGVGKRVNLEEHMHDDTEMLGVTNPYGKGRTGLRVDQTETGSEHNRKVRRMHGDLVGTHVSISINSLQRRLFHTNLPRSSQESIARQASGGRLRRSEA